MHNQNDGKQILCLWNIETTPKQKNFRLHECDTWLSTNTCDVKKNLMAPFYGWGSTDEKIWKNWYTRFVKNMW